MIKFFLLLLFSYLLGSIPFAFIITKLFKKIDIRNYGSKNPGATNVLRIAGPLPMILTLFFDIFKGFLAVYTSRLFSSEIGINILCAAAVILGHNWPVFLSFKGGKGVATAAGVLLCLKPQIIIFAIPIFVFICIFTKYVSVSSLITSFLVVVYCLLTKQEFLLTLFVLVLFCLILVRHKENIKRLIEKKELKI